MAVTLKRFLGEGGALLDDSTGKDNLYDVLKALANGQNAINASLNQLITDYNASTTPTGAAAVTDAVEVE